MIDETIVACRKITCIMYSAFSHPQTSMSAPKHQTSVIMYAKTATAVSVARVTMATLWRPTNTRAKVCVFHAIYYMLHAARVLETVAPVSGTSRYDSVRLWSGAVGSSSSTMLLENASACVGRRRSGRRNDHQRLPRPTTMIY